MKLGSNTRPIVVGLLVTLLMPPRLILDTLTHHASATVEIGTIAVTEFTNGCVSSTFDTGDTLKVSVPITNNTGSAQSFRVLVRMRAVTANSETVDGAYGGPLYIQESVGGSAFDDSFGIVVNTPSLPRRRTYNVTTFLGMHNQFLKDVLDTGFDSSVTLNIDVEVYKNNSSGSATDMFASSSLAINVTVRRTGGGQGPCYDGGRAKNNSTGVLVTDKTAYGTTDPVVIEWGAMGGADDTKRPAYSELGSATVYVRKLTTFPSGDPITDFNNATSVTSLSNWEPHSIAANDCKLDEGVNRSFCYDQTIGTAIGKTGYTTWTATKDDNTWYILMLAGGAGTASHTVRDDQYNYFFVGSPTLISLSSFRATGRHTYVLVEWETASEIDNAGFNLWRSEAEAGPYTRLNTELIPARGAPAFGARYSYVDEAVVKGVTYYYQLEDVDLFGLKTRHGPVTATLPPCRAFLPLLFEGQR